jgi:hypothetical protein
MPQKRTTDSIRNCTQADPATCFSGKRAGLYGTQFQDPGNKIFELAALSVFFRLLIRMPSCPGFPAKAYVSFAASEGCTAWDCCSWPVPSRSWQIPPHWCAVRRSPVAIVIVRSRMLEGVAQRCAIQRGMVHVGGPQAAPNVTCRLPLIIRTPAPDSRIPAARSTRGFK